MTWRTPISGTIMTMVTDWVGRRYAKSLLLAVVAAVASVSFASEVFSVSLAPGVGYSTLDEGYILGRSVLSDLVPRDIKIGGRLTTFSLYPNPALYNVAPLIINPHPTYDLITRPGGAADASGSSTNISRSSPVVVGFLDDGASVPYHAFSYNYQTDTFVDLSTLDPGDTNSFSYAKDVSDDGSVVVGFSDTSGAYQHAFRWTQAGGMVDLDSSSPSSASRAHGVDGTGSRIVGERDDYAVRWDWNGAAATPTNITTEGLGEVATGVTEDGSVIVGMAANEAFRWTQAMGAVKLGKLSGDFAAAALGVSDNGKIVVGLSQEDLSIFFNDVAGAPLYSAAYSRAFRWTDPAEGGNGMEDLNQVFADAGADMTGVTLVAVTGISPDGQWLTGAATTPETSGSETVPFVAQICDAFISGECFIPPTDSDLLADFGGAGLWVLYNNTTWKKIHAASPMHIGSGDLDGTGQDEALASFAGAGLWARFNDKTWVKLHNATARRFATGDLDGNGKDDLIVDFGGAGLWVRYNNKTWKKLHNAPTQEIALGDLDGDGKDELIVDFGSVGLWAFYNNATWKKLHNASPVHIATGDLDGSGKDELIADFGSLGLWARYNNTTWKKLHNASTEGIATGDFDGNGKAELLVDFGSLGLWARYNDTAWKKLHNASPQRMVTADLDSSGKDEAVVDFGSLGLWARYNDKTWMRLHKASPQEIAAGGFD
jgi:probable HAF family extracellular repeat protein